MQLSQTSSPLKRFAWLWGALLGVVLFPVLMTVCYYGVAISLPPPKGALPVIKSSTLLHGLFVVTTRHGGWCSAVGGCGAMLWVGNRSLWWRLPSVLVGAGATSYLLWGLWKIWPTYAIGVPAWERWSRTLYAATRAPLLLAALLLLFFALVMRSPRTLSNKA